MQRLRKCGRDMCSDSKGPLHHIGRGRIRVPEQVHNVSLKQSKTLHLCVNIHTYIFMKLYVCYLLQMKKSGVIHTRLPTKRTTWRGHRELKQILVYILCILNCWNFLQLNIFIYHLGTKI